MDVITGYIGATLRAKIRSTLGAPFFHSTPAVIVRDGRRDPVHEEDKEWKHQRYAGSWRITERSCPSSRELQRVSSVFGRHHSQVIDYS